VVESPRLLSLHQKTMEHRENWSIKALFAAIMKKPLALGAGDHGTGLTRGHSNI
jgi:hypothetical protein